MNKTELIALLRRPFQDREWPRKMGTGALIGLIPVLISLISFNLFLSGCLFISLFYLGYILEWISSIRREPEASEHLPLPEWEGFGKLLANGLVVFVIGFLYFLVPLILLWIGKAMAALGGASIILGYLFKLLSGIGFGIASFIMPAVLIQFADGGKVEGAFSIRSIGEKITSVFSEYLLSYLFSLGLVILVWIIIAILSPIMVGWIFVPILNFYIGLVTVYRFSIILGENGG